MKKILFITAILIGFLGSAQDSIVKSVSLKGRGPFLVKGSMTGTTITGAQIVDSLNLELGSTEWQDGATTDASELITGVLDDGRVQESNVTQHEGALSITESQISDLGSYLETSALIDDDTFATATNTNIPSAESVKAYVDANAGTAGLDQEAASTKTLGMDDAWKVFENAGTDDFIYTIPTQANEAFTEDIAYSFWVGDTGKIFVKGQTGAGVPPREISTIEKFATIRRSGPDNWRWSGTTVAWVNLNPEQYDNSNALGLLNNANATTGLDTFMAASQSSVANTSPAEVDYMWEITSTQISNQSRGREVLTVDDANGTYEVKFWARQSVGVAGGARFGFISTLDPIETAITSIWTYYEVEITADGTVNPMIQFHTNRAGNTTAVGDIGDAVQVTGLTIKTPYP